MLHSVRQEYTHTRHLFLRCEGVKWFEEEAASQLVRLHDHVSPDLADALHQQHVLQWKTQQYLLQQLEGAEAQLSNVTAPSCLSHL